MTRLALDLPDDVQVKLGLFAYLWQCTLRQVLTKLMWLHRHPALFSCVEPSNEAITWLVRHSKLRQFPDRPGESGASSVP